MAGTNGAQGRSCGGHSSIDFVRVKEGMIVALSRSVCFHSVSSIFDIIKWLITIM